LKLRKRGLLYPSPDHLQATAAGLRFLNEALLEFM
jgi:hypothetical protein